MTSTLIWHIKSEIIEPVLGKQEAYIVALVPEWSDQITTGILQHAATLDDESGQSKWIAHVSIIEKSKRAALGLHMQTGALYDSSTDGIFECRWENKALVCTCVLFRLAV